MQMPIKDTVQAKICPEKLSFTHPVHSDIVSSKNLFHLKEVQVQFVNYINKHVLYSYVQYANYWPSIKGVHVKLSISQIQQALARRPLSSYILGPNTSNSNLQSCFLTETNESVGTYLHTTVLNPISVRYNRTIINTIKLANFIRVFRQMEFFLKKFLSMHVFLF